MKGFGSDNHAGVHPELMRALSTCNSGHAPSYGTDNWSNLAITEFKKHFGLQTEVFFVFNGTAANVLALRLLAERHESVLCSSVSHLNVDECGAPEFFAAKLLPLPHVVGKLKLSDLQSALLRSGDQHYSQTRVVSLTQPTELGTCYTLTEIKEIADWAHANKLFLHIDGARLTNALVFLSCSFNDMTSALGVDVVSFGGTKNGFMMGEAILILNPALAAQAKGKMKYIRKQSAQLPSKTRFIAAQFSRYFQDGLFLEIAKHSCAMAERLYQGLKKVPAVKVTAARQSNAVFAVFPQSWVKQLREEYFFYVWDEKTFECRIMTSWDTTSEEIDDFLGQVIRLSRL